MELSALIADALEYRGFVVDSRDFPMKARKGDEIYTVVLLRSAEEKEPLQFMEISGKLLVISLESEIEPFGDEFWTPEEFERTVGRAVISKVMGEGRSPGSIINSFEDAFAESREPVAAERPPVNLEEELRDAFVSAKELRPYYVMSFSIEGEDDDGIILVDAVEARVHRAMEGIEVDNGEITATRMEPVISDSEAMEKAKEFLIKEHTREVEVVHEENNVTVMEKKVISIDEGQIDMHFLGIIYLPMMRIESQDGTHLVDLSGIIE
jgi:hypothetical protein